MKTEIYYFTGTGNSLAAARSIAASLGETRLVPIASLTDQPAIVPGAGRVGIVCPVYDAGLPRIVAEFLERLDLTAAAYRFGIVTLGGTGISALRQIDRIVTRKNGRGLDAAFLVRMPGNFPPVARIAPPAKQRDILAAAEGRLGEIARSIAAGERVPPGFGPGSALMHALLYRPFTSHVREGDRKFVVNDACTACGTCAQVCPAGNIRMEAGRPAWQHRCELCCACLNLCPAEAIQLPLFFGSEGRGRYRHPDLKLADMGVQRGGGA